MGSMQSYKIIDIRCLRQAPAPCSCAAQSQPTLHRAKVNPKPWESRLRDEIGYCYPVGEGESPSPTCLKLSQPGSSET